MKKKVIFLYCSVLIITFFSGNNNQILGQDDVSISIGAKAPVDLFDLGVLCRFDQTEIGGSIGFDGAYSSWPIALDLYYHFAGYSKISAAAPWFGKAGLCYLYSTKKDNTFKSLVYNLSFGRDINFSKSVQIKLEAGAFFSPYKILFDTYVTPGVGFHMLFKRNRDIYYKRMKPRHK